MNYYAGIDLGGTFVKGGIVDEEGNILVKDKIPTGKERPYAEIAADMAQLVLDLAKKAGISPADVKAAGVGSPGTIDSKNGIIVYSNNIRWEKVPLGAELKKHLGIPVFATNDANAAALGESFAGAAKSYPSSVFITLGTGVGGGIIIGGKLFEGHASAGAEIGHMVIERHGDHCTCGRRGCFEAYCSATALVKRTKRQMEENPGSAMWTKYTAETANGKTAFEFADTDIDAKEVVDWYLKYLACGLTNLANIFRPEIIMLGGGVSEQGERLTAPLQKLVDKELFGGTEYAPVKIVKASLGSKAGAYGAAALAMRIGL